jgi:ABC-2 type transport system permease protein
MKTAIAGRMTDRGDFFISAAIMLLAEFIVPLVTILIYRSGASFPGWDLYDALLIQGVFLLAKGVALPLYFGMVWNVLNRVQNGSFDILLLKPRSALLMSIVTGFDVEDLGKLLGGAALFGVALYHQPPPSLQQWLLFVLLFLVSQVVFFSFALLLSGIVFIWVGSSRVGEIFDAITRFGLYPNTVFSKSFQAFLTYVIPVAAMAFLPSAVLLGQPAEGLIPSLCISLIFMLASLLFWNRMLGKYTSAGG